MKTKPRAVELCLPCLVELEEAGFEARSTSTGMVVCAQCGKRCWGGAYRIEKRKERET